MNDDFTISHPVVVKVRHRVLRSIGKHDLGRVTIPGSSSVLVRVVRHHDPQVQVLRIPRKCHRARVIRRATPGAPCVLLKQHQLPALLKRNLALKLCIRPVRGIPVSRNARSLRVVLHVRFA